MPEVASNKPRRPRKIDVSQAVRDRARGLTLSEIASKQGVSKQGIHHAFNGLDKLLANKGELENYRKSEVALLDGAKMKFLLAALDDDKLKSASALQCVTGFGILTDKSLLLQGKATQIVENKSLVLQATKRLEEMDELIRDAQIVNSDTLDTPR